MTKEQEGREIRNCLPGKVIKELQIVENEVPGLILCMSLMQWLGKMQTLPREKKMY